MTLTQEQQVILEHFINNTGITAVSAVAGAGKTTLLTAIAKKLPHKQGLYLAYNTSVANSSKKKFPSTVDCRTIHSLAYQAVVKACNLKVGTFTARNISVKIPYEQKLYIIETIRKFCLSKHTDFNVFAIEEKLSATITNLCTNILSDMQLGKIECTHDFYLKLFHIYLKNNAIIYPEFDFIMLDECGDLNPVTIEIFHLLPSKRKLAVGDPFQNIYSFNYTVNYFAQLPIEATLLPMSQSFRVPTHIAERIEIFCRKYMNPFIAFKGVPIIDSSITTRAYLTRTNASLIAEMIRCNEEKISYTLIRDPKEIFKLPLMLCSLKYKGNISMPEYTYLQESVDEWYESLELKTEYKSPLAYLLDLYGEQDIQLKLAIKLIMFKGPVKILNTYKQAISHVKTKSNYILSTVHTAKGLEWDSVIIASDLNDVVQSTLNFMAKNSFNSIENLPQEHIDNLNLYYVAVSRCKKELHNAIHL